jgi:hypothetical protein
LGGQLIKTLLHEEKSAGDYQISFDARDLPSGIYFYEMKTENFRQSKKMVLIK